MVVRDGMTVLPAVRHEIAVNPEAVGVEHLSSGESRQQFVSHEYILLAGTAAHEKGHVAALAITLQVSGSRTAGFGVAVQRLGVGQQPGERADRDLFRQFSEAGSFSRK